MANGRWRDAEPDPVRSAAYFLAHRALNLPASAEAMQGPTADYHGVVFLPVGAEIRRCVGNVEVNYAHEAQVPTDFSTLSLVRLK